MNTPDTDLAALPRPEPPAGLAAFVEARIAEIEQAERDRSSTRDWPVWVMAAGGLAAVLALAVSMTSGETAPSAVATGPRGIIAGLGAMPSEATSAAAFAAGLFCFVLGLFATTGTRARSQRAAQNST